MPSDAAPSGLDPLTAYPDDPTKNEVHQPYTAFNQGFDAYDAGFCIDQNPYTGRLAGWWGDGYAKAMEKNDDR